MYPDNVDVPNVGSKTEESSLGFGTRMPQLTREWFCFDSASFKFLQLHFCCHRYMKGRVTYDQLNAAVQSINTTVTAKYKILHQSVKTMNNVSRTLHQRFKDQETKDTKGITVLSVCLFWSHSSQAYLTSFSSAVHHVLTVLSYWELRVSCLLQKTINSTGTWTGITALITRSFILVWCLKSSDGLKEVIHQCFLCPTGQFFIVEQDIREFAQLKVDKRFVGMLNMLRHCQRLKEVRGGGLTRFILLWGS